MKLAILGGTGRTGQHLLRQALEEGYEVTALARDPGRLEGAGLPHSERLTVVAGSVTDPACAERVVAGAQAVISVLGPTSNQPTFEISQGMQHILAAMEKHGVRRLIISAGAGVGDPEDEPGLFNRVMNVLVKAFSKNVYLDMVKTVELARSSSLDWTVVRVPMLVDEPRTGQVKVGMVGKGMGPRISRADMAAYMLGQVTSREQVRKAPAISH